MKNYIRNVTLLILFFSSVLLFNTPCNATRLFINPTSGNNDTGDGSLNNPYKTLEKVGLVIFNLHCDTIYILGTFHNGVKDEFKRWDNQNYWIYIRPYNGTNVTLNGLGSTPNSWKAILGVQSSKYVDIKNITVTGNDSASGIRVVSDDAPTRISQYVNIRNCRANNCRRQGILIQAKDVIVENCEIDSVCLMNRLGIRWNVGWDFALGCLLYPDTLLCCQNITFRNNYVHNVWGEGIVVERARNFIIEDNIVRECYSCCIYADKSRYGVIQRNWISINNDYYNRYFDPTYIARANGIFWASENLKHKDSIIQNIDICNNLIYGTGPAFGWFDDSANTSNYDSYRKINIYYNTVFNTKAYQTFYMDTSDINPNRILPDSCNFKNNIICKPKWSNQYERYFTYSTDFADTNKWNIKKNCFIHGPDARFPNNIIGAPAFLDSNTNSPNGFKIGPISNCKDSGVFLNQYRFDYWQARRDTISPSIGFHEYGGIPSGYTNISSEIPKQFSLSQNYPNPFNPSTIIKFQIKESGFTSLKIFDILGKEIGTLVMERLTPGSYSIDWNASAYSSGVYFYRLQSGDFLDTKQMILIK